MATFSTLGRKRGTRTSRNGPLRRSKFQVTNRYCPTGVGGGQDNSCGKDEGSSQSDRSARASASYNPATKEKQQASDKLEVDMAKALGATRSEDNLPMDITAKGGKVGLEVKMVHDGKHDKVHMRPDSRQRKEAWVADKPGRKAYTVIVDNRDKFEGGKHADKYSGNKIYWKQGVGAFRFSTMNTAKNFADLKRQLKL
jgi:hypothetical protein